jgi:hypothetical protein
MKRIYLTQEGKQEIIASEEDAKIFLDAIENPPAPNEKLKRAFEKQLNQETLEKAANKYAKDKRDKKQLSNREFDLSKSDFIAGAKWQAERMYSEEDMIKFAFDTYHYISKLMGVPFNQISENKLHAMYNFEQFKKK